MLLLQITKLCVLATQFFTNESGSEPCQTLPPPCVNEWRTEWVCLEQPEGSQLFAADWDYRFTKEGTYVMQLQANWTSEDNSWQGVLRTDTFLVGPPPDKYLDEYFICIGNEFLPLPDTQPDFTFYDWDTIVQVRSNYAAIVSNEFCTAVEYFTVRPVDCGEDKPAQGPPSVYMPNAFSPNGDGINDEYRIEAPGCTLLHFEVFDRWGGLLCDTYPWDGGGNCPGVYLASAALIFNGQVYTYRTQINLVK